MAGHLMAELAVRPALVDVIDTLHHGESDIGLEEVMVQPRTAAIGKTVAEAGLPDSAGAKLLAGRGKDGAPPGKPAPGPGLGGGGPPTRAGSAAPRLPPPARLP